MQDKSEGVNPTLIDIICEIGNIGAGNAATALSGMLRKRVEMSVPKVEIVPLSAIPTLCGSPESPVVGGMVDMTGDMQGQIMLILGIREAYNMSAAAYGRKPELENPGIEHLTETDMSALSEIVNILAGSYLSAISSMTGLMTMPSIPYMSVDMAGALLSVVAIECGMEGDSALFFETKFADEQGGIECSFFLLPDRTSYQKLMEALGVSL